MNSLLLRSLKGLTPLYYKKLAQTTLSAGFHASVYFEKGRRGGASALEPKPRAPSKKQIKRRKEKRELAAHQKAHSPAAQKVEKAQSNQMMKHIMSEEGRRVIKEAEANVDKIMGELLLPDSLSVANYRASRQLPPLDHQKHLNYLKTLKLTGDVPPPPPVTLNVSNIPGLVLREDGGMLSKDELREVEITSNRAMKELLENNDRQIHKRFAIAKGISEELSRNGLSTATILYAKLIAVAAQTNRLKDADDLFQKVLASEKQLSDDIWAARIDTLVAQNDYEEATKLFNERLVKKPDTECAVYVSQMKNLLKQKDYDGTKAVWMQLHDNGVKLTADAFAVAMDRCTRLSEVERAFFLYDELQVQGIEPNEAVFISLINASGTAPHWVNGYQDTISDALYKLEGSEFVPTEAVYSAVIRAFGKAGDAVAAEYYFWEMRRKGILPVSYTYDALFEAYATAQLVGAKSYGMYGRYVRPKPPTPTKEELAYYALGPEKVAKIITAGYYAEVEEKLGKRTKAVVSDINEKEDDATMEDIHMQEILSDAHFLKQQAKDQEKKRQQLKLQRQQGADTPLLGDGTASAGTSGNVSDANVTRFGFNNSEPQTEFGQEAQSSDGIDLMETTTVKSFKSFSSKNEVEVDFDALAEEDPDLRRLMEMMRKDDPDNLVPPLKPAKALTTAANAITSNTALGMESSDWEEVDEDEDEQLARDPAMIALRSQSAEVANLTAQLLHSNYVLKTADEFFDPFAHVDDVQGRLVSDFKAGLIQKYQTGQPLVQAEKTELVKMLDNVGKSAEELMALKEKEVAGSRVTQEYIDYTWDLINFGRPPNPDYDVPVEERQKQNTHRAELAMKEFVADGLKLNSHILTKYLMVYSNLGDKEGAERVLKMFDTYGLKKIKNTYRALVMMNVRIHHLDEAVRLKDEMVATVGPDAETYGILIEGMAHAQKVVESLQMVEEATSHHLTIRPIHTMKIRARCEKLGVYHPDLGEDPKGWVKDLKKVRIDKKFASKRGIQHVRSAFY